MLGDIAILILAVFVLLLPISVVLLILYAIRPLPKWLMWLPKFQMLAIYILLSYLWSIYLYLASWLSESPTKKVPHVQPD